MTTKKLNRSFLLWVTRISLRGFILCIRALFIYLFLLMSIHSQGVHKKLIWTFPGHSNVWMKSGRMWINNKQTSEWVKSRHQHYLFVSKWQWHRKHQRKCECQCNCLNMFLTKALQMHGCIKVKKYLEICTTGVTVCE